MEFKVIFDNLNNWLKTIAKSQDLTYDQAKIWLILVLSDPNGWGDVYKISYPPELKEILLKKSSMSRDFFTDIVGDFVRENDKVDEQQNEQTTNL